ncbi:amidase [Streptosporangium canum]|uniref:amidase n=1 Tax=Streptosporangium canum TaxID=324952 RepID=UPI00343BBF97
MSELHFLGISELGPMLAARELSPVELCQALLARCASLDPLLNAFVSLPSERILADARVAEEELRRGDVRGPLHGVPIAVKDNIDVEGERTTAGSRVLADARATGDAVIVARLRAAGAIVFGKTNLPEFAYGPLDTYHYGPTRNPWDLQRYAGGSSMGSGSAVAAGLVPGAIGTDTTGSIRNPAAWCGVVGLKPTFGRVPTTGVVPLARTLDHAGPMARSAEDCAVLFDAVADRDPGRAGASHRKGAGRATPLRRSVRGLRAGVLRGFLWEPLSADTAAALTVALVALRDMGLEVVDVEVPAWKAAVEAGSTILACEASAEYRRFLRERPADLTPQIRERLEGGLAVPAPDYVDALRATQRLRAELAELFTRVDVLVLPSRERTAPRMEATGRLTEPIGGPLYAVPLNGTGLPAVSIPCGFGSDGLPIGVQLAGPAWGEATLLALAHAYQKVTDWHARRPRP